MSKPKRAKKQRPTLASTFWGHTSNIPPTVLHAFDNWTEAVGKGEFGNTVFPPLGPEPDNPPVKVNVGKRNLCLAKPTPLMPANQVTDPHPLREIQKCKKDLLMFLLNDSRAFPGSILTDSELCAWVDLAVSKLNRLKHYELEDSQVTKRRVFASATPLPPRQKPVDMGASQLTRVPDTGTAKVTIHCVPAFKVSGKRVDLITVTDPEIGDDPAIKGFGCLRIAFRFFGLEIRQQLARTARLYRVVVSKLRGFKSALAGFRVKKRDPVKRATGPCVK